MNDDLRLCVGFDQKLLETGAKIPLYVDFASTPHLLIAAPSGSGKTYLLTFLLEQLAEKPVDLILCDFKGIDFMELADCSHYYRHSAVGDGLKLAYDVLQDRMHNPRRDYKPLVLVFDEWSGAVLSKSSKKEQDELKSKLQSLLLLGRGCGIFVIIAMQRADQAYLPGRENFGAALGLGRLSPESAKMLFPDDTDQIIPCPRGQGYLRRDGKELQALRVPIIRDISKVRKIIHKKLK